MKHPGPPFGSGPGSDLKLSHAGERTLTRSDAGRASRSSLSQPNPTAGRSGDSVELLIYLEARGQGRFDAFFANSRIATSSTQSICEAARALHNLGYPDELKLVVWHRGANHEAIRGPLGVWRGLRVREDRGSPRFARWQPFPSRPVAVIKGRPRGKATGIGPARKTRPRQHPAQARGIPRRLHHRPPLFSTRSTAMLRGSSSTAKRTASGESGDVDRGRGPADMAKQS
jgi:hypothetical protein